MKPQTQALAVKGSLAESQKNRKVTFAEAFLTVDAIVICDVSASMSTQDVDVEGGLRSRWDECNHQLALLQARHPSKIAVVAFSNNAQFCPNGVLPPVQSSTNMLGALQFVAPADDTGIKFILVSDGEPDDPTGTLALARTLKTPINTIFVGRGRGADFMRELANATKGRSVEKGVELLEENITLLLRA